MARRRRRFVKRMPVNIMKEASKNRPPTTYFNFVTQDLCPPTDRLAHPFLDRLVFDAALLRVWKASLSWQVL